VRTQRTLSTCTLLGLLGCGESLLSFSEDPRPCEERAEVCPATAPASLELADLDRDGAAEFVTLGFAWELAVASMTDGEYAYVTTRVPVEWGSQLSTCSSGEGYKDLVMYRHGNQWWLWRLSNGHLEVVDSGRPDLTTTVVCVDLGPGANVIATFDGATLVLPTATFELQPIHTSMKGLVTMPTGDGSKFSLFAFAIPTSELYVASFDLDASSILEETTWSLNLGRIDALAVTRTDVAVAGRLDGKPELVIVRNVDPAAPVASETVHISLPWQANVLEAAELDGDLDTELVIAAMPGSAVAVVELQGDLQILNLGFEAIDIATGDHDGDGVDEIYALDPREERIIEVPLQSG
jgi:hypothetical protein